MSVCTLAGNSATPAAIGARAHMRADCKSIPSHITLLSFLLRKRRVAVRRKNTFATFPGKRQFHSSRSQAPSARGGKGGPTTSSFQLSPQRNSRTTNPSPPPLFTVGDFPASSSPALHFPPPASRFSYRISKIIVAST